MNSQVVTEFYRGWNKGFDIRPGDIIERWVSIQYFRGKVLISSGTPQFEARFEYVGPHPRVTDASLIRRVDASGKVHAPFLISNRTLNDGESVITAY